MGTLLPTYYDGLIGHYSASFANLVQTGGPIEDGLKIVKSKSNAILATLNWHRGMEKESLPK